MPAVSHKYVLSCLCLSRNRERKNEEKRSRRLRFLNEKRSARKIENRRIRENARRCLKRVSGCRMCVCMCVCVHGRGSIFEKICRQKTFSRCAGGSTFEKHETYNGSLLQFHRVERRQMGAYLCIASNDVPPAVSKRVTLAVNCKSCFPSNP